MSKRLGNNFKFNLTLSVLLFAFSSQASVSKKNLTEEQFVELFQKKSVLEKQNEAQRAQGELVQFSAQEIYSPKLKIQHLQKRTDEKASSLQPLVTPYQETSVSIEKKIPIGIALSAGLFGNQSSLQNGSVNDDTQFGLQVSASVDLWKNIFGKLDKEILQSSENKNRFAKLNSDLQTKKNELFARKIFWSIIASENSYQLSQQLLKSSEKQLQDAIKRQKVGLADTGDVAKYRSQVESRRGQLLLFEYEKQQLALQLEKTITGFKVSDWQFFSEDSKQSQIASCLAQIKKSTTVKYSSLEDLLEELKKESVSEIKISESYSDIDLALTTQWQITGRATGYSAARDNFNTDKKSGYSVGLLLTIPLGDSTQNVEQTQIKVKKNNYAAQIESLENELSASHSNMLKSLNLLSEGLNSQQQNSENLKTSFSAIQRKFQQGRVPLGTLILEQDFLFQSELQEISLKKQIAHATLDYFSIFNKFPCDWNQL